MRGGDVTVADTSTAHWIVDGLGGLVTMTLGWIVKTFHDDQKELAGKHEALAASIPSIYARRDDVKDGFERIEGKLDRLLERRYGVKNGDA